MITLDSGLVINIVCFV